MKDKNKRDLYLKVRVNQEEIDSIKKKFQNNGMDTLSGFVRAMIFQGYIVQYECIYIQLIHGLSECSDE